jgi:hypothetical protein
LASANGNSFIVGKDWALAGPITRTAEPSAASVKARNISCSNFV